MMNLERKRPPGHLLACCLLGLASLSLPAQAAQLQIGAGSRVDFGDASVQLGCADLKIDGQASATASRLAGIDSLRIAATGTLAAGAARLALSGDFVRNGSFSAGSSTVAIVDACPRSTSRISADTTFHHFSVTSGTGKTLELAAGQTTTVQGQLTLEGASGQLLRLRSTAAGNPAQLWATAQQQVQFVDVADSRATGDVIAFGRPEQFQSQAGSQVFRWFQLDAQGHDQGQGGAGSDIRRVPSLSGLGTAALGTLLALAAMACLRRRPATASLPRRA